MKNVPLMPPGPQLTADIELMTIMMKHKLSLNTFKTIFDWATTCQSRIGFDFKTATPRSRDVIFDQIRTRLNLSEDNFKPEIINWLPDNIPTQIFVRPFMNALNALLSNTSLVKEANFLFPDASTPLSPVNLVDDEHTDITELHHGKWWSNSWKTLCKPNTDEILVPIILYMDGISLDAHGRLTLTPLNMTLGIFNVATRTRPDAWETIYFHPDAEFLSSDHSRKYKSVENIQNLHNGIKAALSSFKEACESEEGVLWECLPYAGREWTVKMKFSIAYIIGDTELHDKLCGSYGCRNEKVKQLCRHCNCPTNSSSNPSKQTTTKLWTPNDLCPIMSDEFFQTNSHHRIHNAFHDLDFGSYNPHNIHLCTPGECLHMHQLGVAKRALETFENFVMGRLTCIKKNDVVTALMQYYQLVAWPRCMVLLSIVNLIVISHIQNTPHRYLLQLKKKVATMLVYYCV